MTGREEMETMASTTAEKLADSVLGPVARRFISRPLVVRLAEQELSKRSEKEAFKEVKGRLHQLLLSFEAKPSEYLKLANDLEVAAALGRDQLMKAAHKGLMLHASTRERIIIMDDFYSKVFEGKAYSSVVDLACGLNPLSLPWMGLPENVSYLAADASDGPGAAVRSFFKSWGADGSFLHCDLSQGVPEGRFDVALLMKALPTLDRIKEGLGIECVEAVDAPVVVVSFPTKSLGGKRKGMGRNYEEGFSSAAERAGWSYSKLEFPGELAFIVRK